jgi:hypothetical protein
MYREEFPRKTFSEFAKYEGKREFARRRAGRERNKTARADRAALALAGVILILAFGMAQNCSHLINTSSVPSLPAA